MVHPGRNGSFMSGDYAVHPPGFLQRTLPQSRRGKANALTILAVIAITIILSTTIPHFLRLGNILNILEQLSIWSEALVSGLPNKSGEPGPITVPKAVLSTIDEIGSQLTQAREFVAKYTLNKDTDAGSSKPSGPRRLQAKRRTTKPVRSSS